MRSTEPSLPSPVWVVPHVLILCACLAWAAWRGQDVNWDLQNYHQYDPFALLHARGGRDAAPAGPQSFLNPLPYLMPYLLHRLLPPLAAGLTIAASQSIGLMLAWAIARRLNPRLLPAALATLAAGTGPVVLIELGTSFADLTLATLPLASLLLLLRAPPTGRLLLLSGALTGAAIGIKPTSLFLLASLLAAGVMPRPGRGIWPILAGAVAGALLTDGIWAAHLRLAYGSPLFPFMNNLFRSQSAAHVSFGDPRFQFTGVLHAVTTPFRLALGSDATGELPIRDGRLLLAALLGILHLGVRRHARRAFTPLDAACVYVLVGLAGWLVLCPIERYAVVLEILAGLLAVLLLARVRAAMLLATLLLVTTTRTADYFHLPWSSPAVLRVPAGVSAGATYGLMTHPLADWVATAPYPAASFGMMSTLLRTHGVLANRTDRLLASSDGRLWLLNFDLPVMPEVRAEMEIHGFVLAPPCLRARSLFWIDTVFCRGVLAGPRRFAASDLRIGAAVAFSQAGDGLIYELDGFSPTGPDATQTIGAEASLAFHFDPAKGAILSVRLGGVPGGPSRTVSIKADDGPAHRVTLGSIAVASLCLAPRTGSDGTVLVRLSTSPKLSPGFRLYDMRLTAWDPALCGGG